MGPKNEKVIPYNENEKSNKVSEIKSLVEETYQRLMIARKI